MEKKQTIKLFIVPVLMMLPRMLRFWELLYQGRADYAILQLNPVYEKLFRLTRFIDTVSAATIIEILPLAFAATFWTLILAAVVSGSKSKKQKAQNLYINNNDYYNNYGRFTQQYPEMQPMFQQEPNYYAETAYPTATRQW